MKIKQFIRRSVGVVLSVCILLLCTACSEPLGNFEKKENGNLVSDSGVEYAFLAVEGDLYYAGELEFQGSVNGEEKTSGHLGYKYQTGLYSIKGDDTYNILVRRAPRNEFFSIYRKASLPEFDFSVDNCNRLELIDGHRFNNDLTEHIDCGDGITDASEIAEFLAEVRSQQNAEDAGLYDLIKKPDGKLENCYLYATICGFFEEEPNLMVCLEVWSFNDLAYSVTIGQERYALPEKWLTKLQNN